MTEAQANHASHFLHNFIVGPAKEATAVHREIADEQGLENAKSLFLIRVNTKERANEVADVANLIRASLGSAEVLLLIENEKKI